MQEWLTRFLSDDDDAFEEAWQEVCADGKLAAASVEAVPVLLQGLARGPERAADALYLIAAMCVGGPERLAVRVREAAAAGRETYLRFLRDEDPDTRAAAASALVAAGVADADSLSPLVRDDDPLVRSVAALAFGAVNARIALLEQLLEDDDPNVRLTAGLALQKLNRIDSRVVRALGMGAMREEDPAAVQLPPWSEAYPLPDEAFARLERSMIEHELPFLLTRLEPGHGIESVLAAEMLLGLAFGERKPRPKRPAKLTDLQRRVLDRLVAGSDAWRYRAQIESALGDYGLPGKRRELERWLRTV